jgi:hypothetical protein
VVSLLLLLIAPIMWPFVAKVIWKREITGKELLINLIIGVVIVVVGWGAGHFVQTDDVEIINGQVTGKDADEVPCSHSYSCNCRPVCTTDSRGSQSCTTTCDTCYEHEYDVDYTVHTTVGNIDVDRVDSQGIVEPPNFSRAQIGDPVARRHHFVNYVKAAPDSLFNKLAQKRAFDQFKGSLPGYPNDVHDLYYVDRVVPQGVNVPDVAAWDERLALGLRKLGPERQVNAVVVLTANPDSHYADALEMAWEGGKKNDVVVVLGTPHYPDIAWVRVLSWTKDALFKVQLESDLRDLKVASSDAVLNTMFSHIDKSFQRRHMADFSYLKWEIELPVWLDVLLFVLSMGASMLVSYKFAHNTTRARYSDWA